MGERAEPAAPHLRIAERVGQDADDERPIGIQLEAAERIKPLAHVPHERRHPIALKQSMALRAGHATTEFGAKDLAASLCTVRDDDHLVASLETTAQRSSATSRMNE